jgi:hypothetical protein
MRELVVIQLQRFNSGQQDHTIADAAVAAFRPTVR